MSPDLSVLAELMMADCLVSADEIRRAADGLDEETSRTLVGAKARLDRLGPVIVSSALMSILRELADVRDV